LFHVSAATTIQFKSSSDNISHWLGFKSSQKSFQFEARACKEARIILSSQVQAPAAYEVIIGSSNNMKTSIFRYDDTGILYETVAEEDTPGVLDCTATRYFWLGWNNGLLELAAGSSKGRRLVDWKDDNPRSINAVALRSRSSSETDWQYSYPSGEHSSLLTFRPSFSCRPSHLIREH
jgi:Farnesoic acid 0-methyl transferase